MKTAPRTLAYWLAVAISGFAPSAMAIDCPQPQAASPFVLAQTQEEQTRLAQLLATGDMENRLAEIVAELRTANPGVPRVALVNYLVGAYCPAVNAMPDLNDAAKTRKVGAFAELVFDLLAKQQL